MDNNTVCINPLGIIDVSSRVECVTSTANDTKKRQHVQEKETPSNKAAEVTMSDIIGEFGFFQLSLTLITFVRYIVLAMMTNTGPLIAPSVDFSCDLPDSIEVSIPPNTTINNLLKNKCTLDLKNGQKYDCVQWNYDKSRYGITLTDTFDLVCDREWLRSAFQSTISFGIVMAAVVWGSVSDKNGRKFTVKITFVLSLISGTVSYFAGSLSLYAISRSVCSFSDLGLVVSLSTTIVETLGNKFRGPVCIIVYTGWAFGVMIMPWLTEYFKDFRQLMLFTVVLHICTLPWLMTMGESVRWLLVNGKIEESRKELKRITRWNLRGDESSLMEVDKKFEQLKKKFVLLEEKRNKIKPTQTLSEHKSSHFLRRIFSNCSNIINALFGGITKVAELFQTKELGRTTVTIIWITFNCELLYMLFIIINSDIGDNVKMNYAIGGIMETLATVFSLIIIGKVTRKLSIVVNILTVSSLCLVFAFTHSHPIAAVYMLNSTKLAISILSSILYVTTTEIFPTNLRQTGFGLTGTISSLGAVVAPFFRTELSELIGMRQVLIIVSMMPLTAVIIIPLFLRETKGVELPDNVDDIRYDELDVDHNRYSNNNDKVKETIQN